MATASTTQIQPFVRNKDGRGWPHLVTQYYDPALFFALVIEGMIRTRRFLDCHMTIPREPPIDQFHLPELCGPPQALFFFLVFRKNFAPKWIRQAKAGVGGGLDTFARSLGDMYSSHAAPSRSFSEPKVGLVSSLSQSYVRSIETTETVYATAT